ncbi:response regulator [Amycolatopsis anabasis]|uniref:response regulator n=1 Tax=Amycolatopsis anabasis TaxID=1840409 RepID=UPI001FE74A1D|nr:response regulator transcription factor [Amycolatopsis anabasis]
MEAVSPARLRVLIADDNPVIGAALRALLETQPDIDVVAVAGDADEAINLAGRHSPEVVVLDVRLPGGGGARVARELRRCAPAPALMAFSAHGDARSIAEMTSAGVAEYLVKGTPNAEIIAAIRRVGAPADRNHHA